MKVFANRKTNECYLLFHPTKLVTLEWNKKTGKWGGGVVVGCLCRKNGAMRFFSSPLFPAKAALGMRCDFDAVIGVTVQFTPLKLSTCRYLNESFLLGI